MLHVTIPLDRVQAAETRAVRHYASRVRLPGFRPGKAPEAVVRKRLADDIRNAVIQEVIREGWDAAKAAESLKPLTDPAVRNLRFEEGKPVEFELFVEVKPELKLERLGGFTVIRTVDPVTDQAVEEQVDRIREQKAAWLPVEGQKPLPGQMVHGDIASIEGETVHAAKPFTMVLGSGQAVPALEEQFMAMLPGETRDAEVKFPEDYPDEARRGQNRRVRITLKDVKRQELPAADDALAKEVGDFVFTTQWELAHNRKLVNYPIFTDPRAAVRGLDINRRSGSRSPLPFPLERPEGLSRDRVRSELDGVAAGPIPPDLLGSILAAYRIPLVPWEYAQSEDEAVAAAKRLGFPVVLKTAQPEVIHKSEAGGVMLNLSDESGLIQAYRRLRSIGPSTLVQKMSDPGIEWLIGGRRDRQFGPVVVTGLGGIYVEVFKETAIRIAPIGYEEAGRLVWIMFFLVWVDYYFDVWIITDRRIVNVEQKALFSRVVSELELEKIQDITTTVEGVIPTFLNFGDLHVQTAAEQERFLFHTFPTPTK